MIVSIRYIIYQGRWEREGGGGGVDAINGVAVEVIPQSRQSQKLVWQTIDWWIEYGSLLWNIFTHLLKCTYQLISTVMHHIQLNTYVLVLIITLARIRYIFSLLLPDFILKMYTSQFFTQHYTHTSHFLPRHTQTQSDSNMKEKCNNIEHGICRHLLTYPPSSPVTPFVYRSNCIDAF